MLTKCIYCQYSARKRIKNDLEFQIGRYQSRATCFDIQTSANAPVRIMSKHATLDWYLSICNSRSFLILIFSHMRLRKPTESLVLDRSIRDGDQARGIHALPCKSEQSNAVPIVGIVPLRRWPWRHNTNAICPATSKLLAVISVALHSCMSSYKHTFVLHVLNFDMKNIVK